MGEGEEGGKRVEAMARAVLQEALASARDDGVARGPFSIGSMETTAAVRLPALLARYQKQFAAMDSMVGSVNSQKTSLKSTFEGMMAAYTNK